jgi:hypothetical protein
VEDDRVKIVAAVLVGLGQLFVLSSFYRLGITGTFLGDYCGILMDERVTGFPFNVLDNPMYAHHPRSHRRSDSLAAHCSLFGRHLGTLVPR